MSAAPPLCVDCAHVQYFRFMGIFLVHENPKCNAVTSLDLVTGRTEMSFCRNARQDTKCGPSGKLFRAREDVLPTKPLEAPMPRVSPPKSD